MHSTYITAHTSPALASVNGYGYRFGQLPLRSTSTLCAGVALFGTKSATRISHNQVFIALKLCILCEYRDRNTIENKRNSGLRLYKRYL